VIKLDIEGCELEALRGMRSSLRRFRPRALVTEVKSRLMRRAGVEEPALRDFLADCGYVSTGQVMPFGNELFRPMGAAVEPEPWA
ncbi:MAG TPA: FkbM family methyltransferase, partial [Actinomycetes bacterium]|nr:FkbM family methyltransferase [Actinomycetes bacterium]